MSLLSLFFDVTSKRLVNSLTNSGFFRLPPLYTEDTLDIELMVVKRSSYAKAPFFSVVDIANYALVISVGVAGTVRASQNVWTKNDANNLFSGQLPLDTAGINALANGTEQIFEIRLFDGTSYTRGQEICTINKSVALSGALAVVAGDTALGKIEASEIYMPYELPAGRGITLVSDDGNKKTLLYLDDDGTVRWVNLT